MFSMFIFWVDFKVWKRITPIIIIYFGVAFLSLAHALISQPLDLREINPTIFIYLSIFMLISFASSLSIYIITNQFRRNKIKQNTKQYYLQKNKQALSQLFSNQKKAKLFLKFLLMLVTYNLFSIFSAYKKIGILSGEDFEGALSYGLVGHSFALLMACAPVTYMFYKNLHKTRLKNIFLALLVVSILLLFLKQVKYWVLVPLIWIGIINIYTGNHNLNMKTIATLVMYVLIPILFFFGSYVFILYNFETSLDFSEIIHSTFYHLLGYLFSGLIVLSSLIHDGFLDPLIYRDACDVFSGICNIAYKFSGQELNNSKPFLIPFYQIDNIYGKTGNVPGLWGVFLIHLGWFSIPFYLFLSTFIYFIFWVSERNIIFFLYYTGIISFMFLSWFASYFGLLTIYEVPLFSAFIILLFSTKLFRKS